MVIYNIIAGLFLIAGFFSLLAIQPNSKFFMELGMGAIFSFAVSYSCVIGACQLHHKQNMVKKGYAKWEVITHKDGSSSKEFKYIEIKKEKSK